MNQRVATFCLPVVRCIFLMFSVLALRKVSLRSLHFCGVFLRSSAPSLAAGVPQRVRRPLSTLWDRPVASPIRGPAAIAAPQREGELARPIGLTRLCGARSRAATAAASD